MKFSFVLILVLSAGGVRAQQLPPAEPPKPMPGTQRLPPAEPPAMPTDQGQNPSLRVTTTEVLVPTLVEKKGGGILYGLKQGDFVLEDNGVPQKIRVQEELDTAPVALVVAVEEGGMSALEFDKLAKLGPLLDVFLSDPRSRVALVGFDSTQHLIEDFTHEGEKVNRPWRTWSRAMAARRSWIRWGIRCRCCRMNQRSFAACCF